MVEVDTTGELGQAEDREEVEAEEDPGGGGAAAGETFANTRSTSNVRSAVVGVIRITPPQTAPVKILLNARTASR